MLLNAFKRVIFWSYARTTWQYDILCALILAFIFLTPKGWFEWGKLACAPAHQNGLGAAHKLLIRAPARTAAQRAAHDIERCPRNITEDRYLRVPGCRKVQRVDGRTVAYEV